MARIAVGAVSPMAFGTVTAGVGCGDGQPGEGSGERDGAGWPAPCDAAGANGGRGVDGTDEDH
jgi:hypothetical protein